MFYAKYYNNADRHAKQSPFHRCTFAPRTCLYLYFWVHSIPDGAAALRFLPGILLYAAAPRWMDG